MKMFLVYLVILPLVASVNIGYLTRDSNQDDHNKFELVEKYLKNLTSEITEINVLDCSYRDTDSNAEEDMKTCFKNTFKDNTHLIYGFCDNYVLNYTREFLANYSSYMWCLNTYSIGLCDKHFIMGSSVIPQIHSFMYILSNEVDVIGFIGNNKYIGLDEFYAVRLRAAGKYYGLIVYDMLFDDNDLSNKIEGYIKNISNTNLPSAIFTTVDDIETIKKVLDAINGLTTGTKPKLIYLEGGLNIEEINNDVGGIYIGYNEGNLIFSGYDESMVNNHTKLYNDEYKTLGIKSDYEAIYIMGNILLVAQAMSQASLENTDSFLNIVYNNPTEYGGGEIELVGNNYISHSEYVYEIQNDGKLEMKYVLPISIHFEPYQIITDKKEWTCNFLKSEYGVVNINSITIGFVHPLANGYLYEEERLLTYFLIYLCDYYNDVSGGIMKIPIQPYIIELNPNNITETIEAINDKSEQYDINTIFLSCSSEQRMEITREISSDSIMFFYLGNVEGEDCEGNVIYTKPNLNYIIPTVRYIDTLGFDRVLVLGSKYKFGYYSRELLLERLIAFGYESSNLYYRDFISAEDDYLDHFMQNITIDIFNITPSSGGVIVITAEDSFQIPILQALQRHNLTYENNFHIISFNLNEIIINSVDKKYTANVTFVTHFFDQYPTNSLVLKEFKKSLESNLKTEYPLTNKVGLFYNVFQLIKETIEVSGSIDPSHYKSYLYSLQIGDPAAGPYDVYFSGYGKGIIRLVQFNDTDSYIVVYDDVIVRTFPVYNDKTYTCSWKSTNAIKGKQLQNYYIVACLFDHTTKAGLQKLDSLILTADIINEKGGVNGYDLLIEATGYDDNIDHLIEIASRYSNNSHLLCFFGTSSSAEQDLISPYLDKWDKLLLVMDKAYGEINHITHQYLEYPFYWILYKFNKYIIVSSTKTVLLEQRINYLKLLYEFVGKPPVVDPIMYNDTDPSEAFIKIDLATNNTNDRIAIICILDADIPSFVHEYYIANKYDKEKNPLMLFDYNDYYGDEYTGHYAITSYNTLCKIHPKYMEFKTYLDKSKGNSFDIVNQGLVIIYDSINMISEAKASSGVDSSSSEIRNALYEMTYEGLHETVKIDKSNYISSHMFIGKILEGDLDIVMEIPFPINAKPYNPLKNNQEYYVADFSLANNLTMTTTLFIGIACFFDLTDSSGFLDYLLVQEHVESVNFVGGIQGRPVYTELYQCPNTLDDAAPLIIKFFNRGFNLIVGGCNPEKRNIIQEIIQSLDALLVYTGFNEGHVCIQEIISASVTQGQEVYPTLLHLLYHTSKDLVFLYTSNKLFSDRVTFIKDILVAFGVDVKLFQEVDQITYDEDMYLYLGVIKKSLPDGCAIIALLEGDQSQSLFRNYYNFFSTLEEYKGSTIKDIAKDYTIYLFDNTNTHFNGIYAEGNYVYSSIIERDDPLDQQFRQVYNYIADPEDYIELKDLVVSASTKWLLQVVTEAQTFSLEDIQKQLYITTTETAMGKLVFTMDNDFLHASYFGMINGNGNIDYLLTVSNVWKGESYRMKVNRAKYFECDWKTGMHGNAQQPSYKIGILLPKNPAYRRDALLYYSAIYTVIDKQNDDEGGIDGMYLMLWIIHDEDDPEKAKQNVINMVKQQNIVVIFGGFTVEVRRAVMEASKELDFLFFFPTDYEGEECYYNGYYAGLSYNSFYTLIPILMDLSSYDQYLFYTDTSYSIYFSQHLIDDYAYLGRSFRAVYLFPLSKTDVSDVIKTIKRLSPQGAILINMLEGDAKYNLIPSMKANGLMPPLFYSFNINMNNIAENVLGNDVAGHYYWDSFIWDNSNDALIEVENYFDQLFSYVGITNIIVARGYAMTQIFINIASKCNTINYEEFRKNLYLYPTKTALGEFTFHSNNNMDNVLSYKQWYLDDNGKIQTKIIWQTSRMILSRPFGNIFRSEPLYRCSFEHNNTKYLLPAKKIGIIFSTSGYMKKVHSKAILAAITAFRELYDEDPINGHVLLMELLDYHSDEEYLKTLLDKYDDNNDLVAYVGCSRGQCKAIVEPKLVDYNRLFYYPRLSIGEECNRNMFYTSLVANQYVTRLVEYILQTDYSYYFTISEDIYYSKDFNTMIEAQAAGLIEKVGSFLVSDSNPITYEKVVDIAEKLKTGIIISTVTKIDMFKTFMIYYSRLGIDTSVIGIVDTLLELEEFDNLDMSLRKDVYKLVRYTYDAVTDSNPNYIKKVMNYVDLSMPTGLFESTYASVMLYAYAAKNAGSFDIDEVRKASYGLTLEVGSGVLTLTDCHYVTSPFFIIKYDSNGQYCNLIYSKLDQESPKAWNWNLDDSYGYICSFSSGREDADKFRVPVKRLALIASLTGKSAKETVGLVDAFQLLVSNINDEGGIGGYTIEPDIYDEGSNIDSCRTTIYDYINDKLPLAVFSYLSNDCLDIINPLVESKSILIQLNTIERDKCDSHVFVANNYYEYYDVAMNVIRNRLYNRLIVITPENDEISDYTVDFMNSHYMPHDYISYGNDNEFNVDDVLDLLAAGDDDGGISMNCIIFWGDSVIFDKLMAELNADMLIYYTNVIVMKNIQEILLLNYRGYEYFGYYWKDDPSELNAKFVTEIYQRIDSTVPVSDLMIRARTAGTLLAAAANTIPKTITYENGDLVSDLSIVNVKNVLRNFKSTTLEGEVYFGSNQYLARIPKIILVLDDEKITAVSFEAGDAQLPEALKNSGISYRRCDFSDPNILDGETVPTVVIGIMLPMTGSYKYEGNLLFDSILAAMDEINDSPDKLIGYYIDFKLLDTESKDELLEEKAKEMLNNDNIEFIFGGHSAQSLEILGPIFSNSTKYFFNVGPSYGNRCYKHVIQTHLMPYQLAEATIRKLLEIGTDAFILHTEDYYASNISERIINKMQNMQLTSKGTKVYTTSRDVLKDLNRALNDGGTVIAILNDDHIQSEFYTTICEETDFRYPKYKFINVLLDSRNIEYLDSSCRYGIMSLNSYFEELADSDHNKLDIPYMAETMNRLVHTRIGMDIPINGEIESAYTAVQIWKTIVQKGNSIKADDFKDYFHYYLDVPSGQIEIHTNNYVKRRIYCAEFDENGRYSINWGSTSLYIPKIYDPYKNSDFGCSCDLSDDNKGERYCSDPIVLTFLHETDLGGKTEKYNCLLQDIIIDEINSNGGVLDRELKANHSWITINNAFVNVRSIFELGKSNTYFGCITAECSKEVNRYLQSRDSLYIFTGRDDGYTFNSNLIVSGLSINQRTQALLQYFSSIGLRIAYIIGPERNSTENEIFVISEGFKLSGIEVIGYSMFSPFYDVAVHEVLNKIETILDVYDRIAIINLFIASENEKFVQFITKSSKFENMILFFLKYDPTDIPSEYQALIKGSFVVSPYSAGVSGRESSKFQKLTTSYFQNALNLNELYENSYTSIYLWKTAVEYSNDYSPDKWPDNDYIELSLKYISLNSPSGVTKVLNNNHISKNVYIFRLSESSIMQVYPKQGKENILEAIPIYLNPSECVFTKTISTFQLSDTIRYIIITFSIINCLLCIVVAYIIFKYKKSKIIKSSSPIFLFYTLLSLALLAGIGDIFVVNPNEEYICAFRVWFLASAITFLLSILICKAWRIHKLFNNRDLMRVKMSNWMILKMIGVFIIIELIYLTIWWSVDRSKPKLSYSDTYSTYLEDIYLQECSENIAFIFIQIALITLSCLFGAKIAWSVRKASSEFNESMPLLSTISVILILGVILIPLNYLMDSEPDTLMGIRGVGTEIGVFFIVLILFGNKISYIYLFELRTTWLSSSLSRSGSTSRERSKQQKKQASRGRFRVTPHLLDRLPIEMATISESDRFFLDSEIEGITYDAIIKKSSKLVNNPLASTSNS